MLQKLSFLLFCLFSISLGQAADQKSPLWTPEDVVTYPVLTMGGISSNGKYTLMEVSYTFLEKEGPLKFTECVLINNDTLEKRPIGNKEMTCSQPHFIGEGEKFTYILFNKKTDTSTLFVEGPGSQQRKIQELAKDFVNYAFAPDGKSFAFKTQEVLTTFLRVIEGEGKDEKRSSLSLQKVDGEFQCVGKPNHLISYIEETRLDSSSYVWAPNSQKMAILTQKPDWRYPLLTSLSVLDVNKGTLEAIDEGRTTFLNLIFSPDSQNIAFIKGGSLSEQVALVKPFKDTAISTIQIVDLKTKKRKSLPAEDLWGIAGWTDDGQTLIGNKQVGTKIKIYTYDIHSKKLSFKETPGLSYIYDLALSQNQKYLGFLGENFSHPQEVYVANLEDFHPKKISALNEKIDLSPIQAKSIKWKSFDGTKIEGILVYPQNYTAGEKVPLIVSLHGGPSGVESEQFIGDTWFGPYSPAVFSSQGYATLFVNYRGSLGYGREFMILNEKDFGGGDFKDIMAGVDFLVKDGIADPKQLFITGHSYGGFMTAWAIGHTNRFKAAVMKAGISDWTSSTALTDTPTGMESYFGNFYWDNYDLYRNASPLSYVNDIITPTLIIHGGEDKRVSSSESERMWQALSTKKVPTQYLLYKGEEHGISSPLAQIDAMKEQLKWFEKYRK